MNEEHPLKRSTVLAVENIKRIADQLRGERNDALALAQVQRERADKLAALLREARESLSFRSNPLPPQKGDASVKILIERIDQLLSAR